MKCRFGMLCRLVALALIASKDVLLDERRHLQPPIVARDEFQGSVFAGMTCGGGVVTRLHDFSAELLVVGNIQLAAVVEESIGFFPFQDAIGELAGSFGLEGFERLDDNSFSIHAVTYALLEGGNG